MIKLSGVTLAIENVAGERGRGRCVSSEFGNKMFIKQCTNLPTICFTNLHTGTLSFSKSMELVCCLFHYTGKNT